MKRSGGFRTRPRVVELRVAWSLLHPGWVVSAFWEEWARTHSWKGVKDYQHRCPHPPEERRASTAGFITCGLCDMTLRNPGRWNVWPVSAPNACGCGLALRTAIRRDHELEVGPMRRSLTEEGVTWWENPDLSPPRPWPVHYAECPQVWMDVASEPHAVAS